MKNKIHSVAFPSISTGAFSFPSPEATDIALKTILEELNGKSQIQKIKFVLHIEQDLDYFLKKLKGIVG